MSFLRVAATNTLYQVISKIIALISGLLVTRILTQQLSPADYGLYTLVTNLVLLTVSLTEWGTGFIAVRASSQKKFAPSLLFSSLFWMRLATVILGFFFLIGLAQFNFLGIPAAPLYISLGLLLPLTIKNVFQSIFQYLLKFKYTTLVEIIGNIGYLLLLGIFQYKAFLNLNSSIAALSLITFVSAVVSYIIAVRFVKINFQFSFRIIKYLLTESAPLGAQLLIFSVYNRLDTYVLQYFKGEVDVALYGLAYRMYSHFVMGAAFVMNAIFPEISQIGESEKMKQLYRYCYHFLLISGLVVAVGTFIFAAPLINLINTDYKASILALQLLSPALFFAYLNHLTGYTLVALHRQHVLMWTSIISLIINFLLNIIFLPRYSFFASSVITVITEASMLVMTSIYLKQQLNLQPHFASIPHTFRKLTQIISSKLSYKK